MEKKFNEKKTISTTKTNVKNDTTKRADDWLVWTSFEKSWHFRDICLVCLAIVCVAEKPSIYNCVS